MVIYYYLSLLWTIEQRLSVPIVFQTHFPPLVRNQLFKPHQQLYKLPFDSQCDVIHIYPDFFKLRNLFVNE